MFMEAFNMRVGNRELLVMGDRVLVQVERPEERTNIGLYLPQTVIEKEKVASGRIVSTGPGTPLPSLEDEDDAFWKDSGHRSRHIPMQARVGDYALYLRKSAVEVKVENDTYLVVPQAAILVIIREEPGADTSWKD